MITIKSESFISKKDKREINEDYLQFQSGKFYIICDGLGGNGNGQIASKLVAKTVKESLLKSKPISEAIEEAEKVLSTFKQKNPTKDYMATTIAVTEILDYKILVSWAGDSRIYQFRNGEIIYKTSDHSIVSEAIKKGLLTEVEALFHPDANRLTRSVKGNNQPVKMVQIILTDIIENDYFLIYSDGIIESWIDSDLEELFSKSMPSNYLIEKLDENCSVFSNDNYTAIIYQVGLV